LKQLLYLQDRGTVEFSSDWFQTIGVTVILVQLGDLVAGQGDNLFSLYRYYSKLIKAKKDEKVALTQAELQAFYRGPNLDLPFKYAQMMSTVFTCMMYSAGMPILNFIATANFTIFYFVEKFMFVRVYQSPRRYNSDLGRQASNFIPIAFLIHLGVGLWIYSNAELFQTGPATQYSNTLYTLSKQLHSIDAYQRVTQDHTYRIFLFFVAIFVIVIVVAFNKKLYRNLRAISSFLCGDAKVRDDLNKNYEDYKEYGDAILYTRAVQRNVIKGLATYNPLENPDYKDAFGISWKFALAKHNIRDVKNFEEFVEADDADAVKVEVSHSSRHQLI
jgi:hypothetical protein